MSKKVYLQTIAAILGVVAFVVIMTERFLHNINEAARRGDEMWLWLSVICVVAFLVWTVAMWFRVREIKKRGFR